MIQGYFKSKNNFHFAGIFVGTKAVHLFIMLKFLNIYVTQISSFRMLNIVRRT